MERDDNQRPEIDPTVVRQYRSMADERPPGRLDRAIMQQARVAAASPKQGFGFLRWMRPLAVAATAVLSLALLLNSNESGLLAPPAAVVPDFPAPVERDTAPATTPAVSTDDANVQRTAADTASALRREKAPNSQNAKTTVDSGLANHDVADTVGNAAPAVAVAPPQAEIIEGNREPARLGGDPASPSATSATARNADAAFEAVAQPSESRFRRAGETPQGCTDEQKANTVDWWRCIEALQNAGITGIAAGELEALQAAHPAFAVPE